MTFVVGGVPLLASTPGVAEQFRLRLDSVMTNNTTATWTTYAAYGKTC